MMMDPLVGALCNPKEIWQMVDEMLVAHEPWLPQYGEAIAKAKGRLENEPLIPTKQTDEAARIPIKSVEEMAANRDAMNQTAGAADKAKKRQPTS